MWGEKININTSAVRLSALTVLYCTALLSAVCTDCIKSVCSFVGKGARCCCEVLTIDTHMFIMSDLPLGAVLLHPRRATKQGKNKTCRNEICERFEKNGRKTIMPRRYHAFDNAAADPPALGQTLTFAYNGRYFTFYLSINTTVSTVGSLYRLLLMFA